MDDEQVTEAIRELEDRLRATDAPFVRRFDRARSRLRLVAATTVALLVAGAVLLSAGLARLSLLTWALGVFAVLAAFALDLVPRSAAARRS